MMTSQIEIHTFTKLLYTYYHTIHPKVGEWIMLPNGCGSKVVQVQHELQERNGIVGLRRIKITIE